MTIPYRTKTERRQLTQSQSAACRSNNSEWPESIDTFDTPTNTPHARTSFRETLLELALLSLKSESHFFFFLVTSRCRAILVQIRNTGRAGETNNCCFLFGPNHPRHHVVSCSRVCQSPSNYFSLMMSLSISCHIQSQPLIKKGGAWVGYSKIPAQSTKYNKHTTNIDGASPPAAIT